MGGEKLDLVLIYYGLSERAHIQFYCAVRYAYIMYIIKIIIYVYFFFNIIFLNINSILFLIKMTCIINIYVSKNI